MADSLLPSSTLEDVDETAVSGAALWGRRGFVTALALVVLASLLGLLGVRAATTSRENADGSWQISVRHAAVARAGLDVPWQVTVRHEGGFDGPITLAVTGDYFDIFETQGFNPEPSASSRDGETMYLEFDEPPGDTFVVAYDAYIQPSSQVGAGGTVGLYDGNRVFLSAPFDTVLLP